MDSSGVRRSAGGVRMDGRRRQEAPLGIIRKTLSISTLGIVPFRSKKELLHRAEQGQQAAQDRKSVGSGPRVSVRVDPGGRRTIKNIHMIKTIAVLTKEGKNKRR